PTRKMREAPQMASIAVTNVNSQPVASCQKGIAVKLQRKATVRNDVVGKRVKKTSTGLSGLVKTSTVKKKGNAKSRFNMPAICCACCVSVAIDPTAVMKPAMSM